MRRFDLRGYAGKPLRWRVVRRDRVTSVAEKPNSAHADPHPGHRDPPGEQKVSTVSTDAPKAGDTTRTWT